MSVYPASAKERQCPHGSLLTAANGTKIPTFDSRTIQLCFPGLQTNHSFLLADVKHPILGSDFFVPQDLVIDISRRRLTYVAGVLVRA